MASESAGVRIHKPTRFEYIFRLLLEQYSVLILVILAGAVFSHINPRFLSESNLINLSRQIVPLGLIAIGATLVLIGGGLDLSAGTGTAMCGVAVGVVFVTTGNVLLALVVGIAAGLAIGTINGLLVARAGFNSVIVTLAMWIILQGAVQLLLGGRIVFLTHPVFRFIGRGTVGGIPFAFLLLMTAFGGSYYLLNHTRYGVHLYAVGGNMADAEVVGIRVPRIRFVTFLLSGLLMGLAGLVLVSRIALVSPNLSGFPILLNGVSAAVIGGVSVTGGRGRIGGVFLGVLFIGVVSNAINFLNITPEAQDLFRGLVVLFALLFQRATIREERWISSDA